MKKLLFGVPVFALAALAGQAMAIDCTRIQADFTGAAAGGPVVNGCLGATSAGATITVTTDTAPFTFTAVADGNGAFQVMCSATTGSTASVAESSSAGTCTVTFVDSGPKYAQAFDGLTSAPAVGAIATGQDNFYNPVPATSTDSFVFIHGDNPLVAAGLTNNPTGGTQFLGAIGTATTPLTFARTQRVAPWHKKGKWKISYDVTGVQIKALPTDIVTNNLGSFSLQLYPGSSSYINLLSYPTDPVTLLIIPDKWQFSFVAYNAAGVADVGTGRLIGPEFTNLTLGKWYRFSQTIDFDVNRVISASITPLSPPPCKADCDGNGLLDIRDFTCFQNAFATGDLSKADVGGPTSPCGTPDGSLDISDFTCFQNLFALGCPGAATTTVTLPEDVYMGGGSALTQPSPTGFRFFGGGGAGAGVARNATCWDNFVMEFVP